MSMMRAPTFRHSARRFKGVLDMLAWIGLSVHSFGDFKNHLVDGIGFQRDALHIHFGLLIFFAAKLLWRGPRGAWMALGLVVAITLGAEIWDHLYERSIGKSCDWPDHLSDIFNTCFWPLVLALLWRRWERR